MTMRVSVAVAQLEEAPVVAVAQPWLVVAAEVALVHFLPMLRSPRAVLLGTPDILLSTPPTEILRRSGTRTWRLLVQSAKPYHEVRRLFSSKASLST